MFDLDLQNFTPELQPVTSDASGVAPAAVNYPQPFNASPYLTMAGGGLTAYSQFSAGRQTASLLRANAAIAGLQGRGEQEAGAEQAELYRQHLDATLGRQAAQIGGSNVTLSGSALRSLSTTAQLGAQDIARIQTNAARKAWGFQVTQAGDEMRADMANRQGKMAALGSLITTGAKAYGQWQTD